MAQQVHTVVDISDDAQSGTSVVVTTNAATVQVNIPPATPPRWSAEVEPELVSSGNVAGQYVDGCEQCLSATRGWYLRPITVTDRGEGVIAAYAHRRCGKRWFTSWAKEPTPSVGIHGDPEPSRLGDMLRDITAGPCGPASQRSPMA